MKSEVRKAARGGNPKYSQPLQTPSVRLALLKEFYDAGVPEALVYALDLCSIFGALPDWVAEGSKKYLTAIFNGEEVDLRREQPKGEFKSKANALRRRRRWSAVWFFHHVEGMKLSEAYTCAQDLLYEEFKDNVSEATIADDYKLMRKAMQDPVMARRFLMLEPIPELTDPDAGNGDDALDGGYLQG